VTPDAELWDTDDHLEGVRAFLARRDPHARGG
jgi:hypothetical protein